MAARRAAAHPGATSGREGKILSFRVGELLLAVPADAVAQIVRSVRTTRVPHGPAALTGIANLRGAIVPILSLGRLLDRVSSHEGPAANGPVIILDRVPPMGLAVDSVTALATVADLDRRGGTLFVDEAGSHRLVDLDRLLENSFRDRPVKPAATAKAKVADVAPSVAEEIVAVLGFELAGQDYALPLEHVREVIAQPAELVAVPRGDAALLGATPYRGGYLPLASLGHLLGLPPSDRAGAYVIVAQIGAAEIGLTVDHLTAVIRAPASAVGPVPPLLNRGGGEARIDAIFRRAGGGLVSILAPERLFEEETTATILAEGYRRDGGAHDGAEGETGRVNDAETAKRERFVIFTLADEAYGLPIAAVDEIVRLPEQVTRMPRAPAFVEGVMNFRGEVIPLIDLGRRFDVGARPAAARRRVLVTRLDEIRAGFIVDSVSEVADLSAAETRAAPALPGQDTALFDRVVERAGRQMILLVDPAAMLDRVEQDLLKALRGAGSEAAAS